MGYFYSNSLGNLSEKQQSSHFSLKFQAFWIEMLGLGLWFGCVCVYGFGCGCKKKVVIKKIKLSETVIVLWGLMLDRCMCLLRVVCVGGWFGSLWLLPFFLISFFGLQKCVFLAGVFFYVFFFHFIVLVLFCLFFSYFASCSSFIIIFFIRTSFFIFVFICIERFHPLDHMDPPKCFAIFSQNFKNKKFVYNSFVCFIININSITIHLHFLYFSFNITNCLFLLKLQKKTRNLKRREVEKNKNENRTQRQKWKKKESLRLLLHSVHFGLFFFFYWILFHSQYLAVFFHVLSFR